MKIENVVVISLSDYEEYQELKRKSVKKEIDFSRLKTGSKVKIGLCPSNNLTAGTSSNYKKNVEYSIILIESEFQVSEKGIYHTKTGCKYSTLVNGNDFIHVIGELKPHITEVIEY